MELNDKRNPEPMKDEDSADADADDEVDTEDSTEKQNFLMEKLSNNISTEDIQDLLDNFEQTIKNIHEEQEGEKILAGARRIQLLGHMLEAWWEGHFSLPWRSASAIAGTLLYFINPQGIIKEKLTNGWFLSDAIVVSLCCHLVNEDLRRFISKAELDPQKFGFKKEEIKQQNSDSSFEDNPNNNNNG